MYSIYVITNNVDDNKYVGYTNNPRRRFNDHKHTSRNPNCAGYNRPLYKAMREFGEDKFEMNIVDVVELESDAEDIEAELISKLNTKYPNGYNLSERGRGTGVHKTEVEKVLISERQSGAGNSFYGRTHSEETKAKFRNRESHSAKGKESKHYGNGVPIICINNGKTYNCIADAGRELGLSTGNIIAVCKGRLKHTKGYVFKYLCEITGNKEGRLEPRNGQCRRVVCVETSNEYESIRQASIMTGLSASGISRAVSNKSYTCGTYHWMYYEDYLEQNKEE